MSSKRWSVLGTVFALSVLTACGGAADDGDGGGDTGGGGGETIKIGVYAPVQVPQGVDVRDGAQLAVDQINEDDGIDGRQVEMIFCDSVDGAQTDRAINCARQFAEQDQVDAIIGGFSSGETLAMLDTVVQAQIPYLSTGAASPDVVKDVSNDSPRKYIFRVSPISSTALAADMCATYVTKLAPATGWTKFGILYEDVEFARPLVQFLQACLPNPKQATAGRIPVDKGVEVVGVEKHGADATDFSSQFRSLQNAGAQFVIEVNSRQEGVALARQWGTLKPPFALGGINVAGQANGFFEATGKAAAFQLNGPAGIVKSDKIGPETVPFFEAFNEKYGRDPIYNGAGAYDAVMVLKEAIERAGSTTPDDVVAELAKTDTTGVQGKIVLNENHDLTYGAGDPTVGVSPLYYQFGEDGSKNVAFPEAIADGYTYKKPPFVK